MLKKFNPALWGIVAAGVLLRLVLAAAQLPFHYQADEFQVIERALRVGAGELNPGLFTWPGTLVIYLNFIAFAGVFVYAKLTGAAADAAAFADLYWRAPGFFYYVSRAITAAFAASAIWATWRWARDAFGRPAGYTAAAFVAFAPVAVAAGAIGLPDMAAAALGAASLAFAVSYLQKGQFRYSVLAGVFLGLGAASKYHVLFFVPALIACWLIPSRGVSVRVKACAVGAAGALVAFVVACPFAVLDASSFVGDLAAMANRPGMVKWAPDATYFVGTIIPQAAGWFLIPLIVAGVVPLIRRPSRYGLVIALAAAPFVVAAVIRPLPPRHLLPLISPLAVAAGAFAADVASWTRPVWRRLAFGLVALLITLSAAGAVGHVTWAWRTDTRTEAFRYFKRNVPAGTPVILESLPPDVDGPPLWPDRASLERLIKYYRLLGGGSPGRYAYQLKNPRYPFGRTTYETYLFCETGGTGAIPTGYAVRVVPDDRGFFAEQGKPYGTPLAPWADEYDAFLRERGHLVHNIPGAGRPGPTVEIYELP
ncbi:MAG: glycosyltransferase family 39 protein [Candidatus Zixiibacteriota bacterium]